MVSACCDSRAQRERKRERERERNFAKEKLLLFSSELCVCLLMIKRNVVSKKDVKRRKKEGSFFFFFRRLPPAPLCFGRFTQKIIFIIIRFVLKPMNNEYTNTSWKCWLWWARAARRWKKTATKVSKFDRLSLASTLRRNDKTTREKKIIIYSYIETKNTKRTCPQNWSMKASPV